MPAGMPGAIAAAGPLTSPLTPPGAAVVHVVNAVLRPFINTLTPPAIAAPPSGAAATLASAAAAAASFLAAALLA